MAGGNKEQALLLMANHVQAATAIYKNTGFAVAEKPEGMVINLILFQLSFKLLRNISTTSARVLSGVPNTEKQMKARGRFGRVLLLFQGVWNA